MRARKPRPPAPPKPPTPTALRKAALNRHLPSLLRRYEAGESLHRIVCTLGDLDPFLDGVCDLMLKRALRERYGHNVVQSRLRLRIERDNQRVAA